MKGAASAFLLALAVAVPATARAQSQAAKATLDAKSEAALRERVTAWWHAREKHEHRAMYDLFEPAYRSKVSFAEFMPESNVRSRFEVSAPAVKQITAETEDRAKVVVEFRGMVPLAGQSFPIRAEETWVRVDGEWYRIHPETPKTILPTPDPPAAAPPPPSSR